MIYLILLNQFYNFLIEEQAIGVHLGFVDSYESQ